MTLRLNQPRTSGRTVFSLLGGVLLFCSTASADLGGVYASELGVIRISEKAGVVTGTLVSASACGQKKGARVLEGTLFEDSITGDIRACQIGPKCNGDVEGLVMLLVTRNGRALSGAAHFDTKCKTALKTDALSFRRQKSPKAAPGDVRGKGTSDGRVAKPADHKSGSPKETTATRTERTATSGTSASTAAASNRKPGGKSRTGRTADAKGGQAKGAHGKGAKGKGGKGKHATSGKGRKGDKRQLRNESGKGTNAKAAAAREEDALPSAGPVYRPVSKKHQRSAVALAQEAALLLNQGKAEEARAKFEESVVTDPNYSQGYNGIGITYYMRDRYDEAKEQYQLALEADPANHDVYYNLACIHALTKEKEQAIGYLQISLLNGYIDLQTLANDADLKNLAGDERFEALKKGEVR